ncbi:LptE family protein [Phycisphaerales bacterium AB-hyl4]|uniref:LptE family protein n=1 Tax=Natronomicrosphaera hydrolytica TaxID=3242702 RepID=A0ABV4U5V4_9BACT
MMLRWAMAVCLCGLLVGCGYSPEGVYDDRYRTVAVPIFENRTFWERMQFDLTEAVVKELEQRTPYTVAPSGVADTILQGSITRVEQRRLSRRQEGGVPDEMELTITVDFEWIDLRSGETIRERRGFEAVGRYAPTRPAGERFESGQHAAVQQLARDIVSTMRADW